MEEVTIVISKEDLHTLMELGIVFTLKKVEIKDEFFKEDKTHYQLKKNADQAYKQLKEYEFKKRNP